MVAFLFPGQGSQKKGMGKELFKKYPTYVESADRILGYSIEELCIKNPENKLNSTEYTQVAIFIVNTLTYLYYTEAMGINSNYAAGHSLGEYNALLSANVFDFETGLKLVSMRGKLMGKIAGGGMAAILGLSGEQVEDICKKHTELSISIANYNTDTQTIISGEKKNIIKSKDIFTSIEGVKFLLLNVSGAFHSPYMKLPKLEFETYISKFKFRKPEVSVISNLTAKKYKEDEISKYLIEQMVSPVRWKDTIRYLLDQGVRHFIELGQGKTLTRMVESIKENYVSAKIYSS